MMPKEMHEYLFLNADGFSDNLYHTRLAGFVEHVLEQQTSKVRVQSLHPLDSKAKEL